MERNKLIDFLAKRGDVVYLEKNEQGNMYISYIYLSDDELRLSSTYGIDRKDLEENLKYCLAKHLNKDRAEVSLIDILSLGSGEYEEIKEATLEELEAEIKTSISEEDDNEFKSFISNQLKDVNMEKLPMKKYYLAVFDFFFSGKDKELFVSVF